MTIPAVLLALCLSNAAPLAALTPHAPPAAQDPAAPQERILVPGTRVRIAPPPGHAAALGHLGFTWPDSGSSLALTELPTPYAESLKSFTAEILAKRGMTVISESEVKIDGRDAKLVYVSHKQRDIPTRKWLAATGNEKRTLLFTAAFAEPMESKQSEAFKAAILGALWDPSLEIDPFALLAWKIETPKGLRYAANLVTSLLFTEDGEGVSKEAPGKAALTITPAAGSAKAAELQAFAEARARALPGVGKTLAIETSRSFTHGLRQGWEIVGKARDEGDTTDLAVHVIVLAGEADAFTFAGTVGAPRADEWLDAWRACAQSWMPKAKSAPAAK